MAQWMVWSILAAVVVILELFSGTFYLLMVAIGLVGGALVAFAGGTLEVQLIVAAVVGLLATSVLHHNRGGRLALQGVRGNPDMNLDVGQAIQVDEWIRQDSAGSVQMARVMYRGAMWDVELAKEAGQPELVSPGRFLIRDIHGSRLIVARPSLL